VSSRRALLVDACVAINIRASEAWQEIFEAGGWMPVMPSRALDEVLYVLDDAGERRLVPLRSYADDGWFEIWELSAEEAELLVQFAAELGPGEAACLAMAATRGAALATDDRLARSRARSLSDGVDLVSTSELVAAWAQSVDAPAKALANLLRLIEERARFRPSPADPLVDWWMAARR
jgi:predicted nucleic acid-binding protein